MEKVFCRSPYNYDMDEISAATGLSCPEPSKAVQSERDECDINTIVQRFGLTGRLPQNVRMPQYGDFEGIADYQGALNAVRAAATGFMAFPADLRARFHNDPGLLIEFVSREENRDEAVRLGLIPKKQEVTAVRVVQDPAAGPPVVPAGSTVPT